MSERPRKQPQKLTVSRVLFRWRFPVIIVLILIVLCCIPVGYITHKLSVPKEPEGPDTAELYQQAVYDTLLAEQSELPSAMATPLVTLDSDSKTVDHDENGRVLLCMWHRSPDIYRAGTDVTLRNGDIIAVSAKELADWYAANHTQVSKDTPDLRLQQLFGLPPLTDESTKNTYFSTFWVNPDIVVRPAYSYDAKTVTMTNGFTDTPDPEYYNWFTAYAYYCYTQANRCWTRMGYTYDWYPESETHYGLTEFLVRDTQIISVANTYTTAEFLQQMASNTLAATDDAGADSGDDKTDDNKDDKKDS